MAGCNPGPGVPFPGMRSALLLGLGMLAGCLPARELPPVDIPPPPARPTRMAAPAPTAPSVLEPVAARSEPQVPKRPVPAPSAPRVAAKTIEGITFEGVSFDSRTHRLRVLDQADGPGSHWADAAAAATSSGGIAAINAGFFTPEGAPLGKVVTNRESRGGWNRSSSLGSGVWLESADGTPSILRREAASPNLKARELLQAGPMLVEQGNSVAGLDSSKSAVRTLILWDGGQQWWIGRTSPCSLAALAAATRNGRPGGWPVHHALNLDGGRSADLWVSAAVDGGPLTRRSILNRPVRNFLVLAPR